MKRRSKDQPKREKGGKPAVSNYALKRFGADGPPADMLFTVNCKDAEGNVQDTIRYNTRKEALEVFRHPEETFCSLSVVATLELDGPNLHIERDNQFYQSAAMRVDEHLAIESDVAQIQREAYSEED